MEKNMEKNMAYIKVHKSFTKQMESKIEDKKTFNIFRLPPNVKVGDRDLSGGILNPFVMIDDKYNKNMVVACYDKSRLEDNSVIVNIKNEDGYEKVKVDIDVLADKVREANKLYVAEKHKDLENDKDKTKEDFTKEHEKSFGIREHEKEYTY